MGSQFMVSPPLSGEVWSESPALVSLWSVTLSGEGWRGSQCCSVYCQLTPQWGLWSAYFMELNRASIEYHLLSAESPPQTTCLSRDWTQLWGDTVDAFRWLELVLAGMHAPVWIGCGEQSISVHLHIAQDGPVHNLVEEMRNSVLATLMCLGRLMSWLTSLVNIIKALSSAQAFLHYHSYIYIHSFIYASLCFCGLYFTPEHQV